MYNFYHRTNNLDHIVNSGRVKALKHIARGTPDIEIEVEPDAGGSNIGGLLSDRRTMSAQEAYEHMSGVKDTDNVFVTKDVLPSDSYGKYIIEKRLSAPKLNDKLNLIANEYITPRELSVRSNANVYVPDDEYDDAKAKYRDLKIFSMKDLKAKPAGLVDHVRTLYQKLTKEASVYKRLGLTQFHE